MTDACVSHRRVWLPSDLLKPHSWCLWISSGSSPSSSPPFIIRAAPEDHPRPWIASARCLWWSLVGLAPAYSLTAAGIHMLSADSIAGEQWRNPTSTHETLTEKIHQSVLQLLHLIDHKHTQRVEVGEALLAKTSEELDMEMSSFGPMFLVRCDPVAPSRSAQSVLLS